MSSYHCPCCGLFHTEGKGEIARLRAEVAGFQSIRDLLVKSLVKATGRIKEDVDLAAMAAELERERDEAEENFRIASAEWSHAQQLVMNLERRLAEAQAEIAKLKTMNDTLWRALSPERRHELNLKENP
ncbi:MAG TPA: hypothetical protein VIH42_07765 [Thermoguttaceae bacterium]